MAASGQGTARRRAAQRQAPRSNRVNLAYNDVELTFVREAAQRDGMALSAWTARSALAVAKELLVPVSADARDVLVELVRARGELVRVAGALEGSGSLAGGPAAGGAVPVMELVEEAVRRVDRATLQVMRERVARS